MIMQERHSSIVLTCLVVGILILVAVGCQREMEAAAGQPAASSGVSTQGINYDPVTPVERLSYTPLKLEATAQVAGKAVELTADYTSWIVGATLRGPGGKDAVQAGCKPAGEGRVDCGVYPVRFAQFGVVEKPVAFSWMCEVGGAREAPMGTVNASVNKDGGLVYPGKVRFAPNLLFTVQEKGGKVLRLQSRTTPVFDGFVNGWPLGLLVASLANGPVPFFAEGQAKPYLVLTAATFAFADKPSEFFRRRVKILSTSVVGRSGAPWAKTGAVGGVELKWEEDHEVLSSRLSRFNVYRSFRPGDLKSWELVAKVPVNQKRLVDAAYDGKKRVAYLVTHEMEYPFDRVYEGIYGPPTVVEPVVR